MTGSELARVLRRTKGKVHGRVLIAEDTAWMVLEKADLILWALQRADFETGMEITAEDGALYLDSKL